MIQNILVVQNVLKPSSVADIYITVHFTFFILAFRKLTFICIPSDWNSGKNVFRETNSSISSTFFSYWIGC